MKTKPRSTIAVLLLGAFLLAWAGTANAARQIEIRNALFTLSSLNDPLLTAEDTITVYEDGILWVDTNAVIKDLIIGSSGTRGSVLFAANPSSLTVANDVVFGTASDNALDMAYITPFTAHTLTIGRSFLRSGNGTFKAGSATIVYNGTASQSVTARVGLGGATIQYKDVILKGSPADGNATKVFDPGVSINGLLAIEEKAQATGSPVTYGNLARLQYRGLSVTASSAEWPSPMTAQITINPGTTVTLDADRQLGPSSAYPNVLIVDGVLKDGGKTLTVLGNIVNNNSIEGAGFLRLDGSVTNGLSGAGVYGNVILKNSAGAWLTTSAVTQPLIRGRLDIQAGSGKLGLPTGTSHQVSLLTFGGQDKPAGVYSATTDPNVFTGNGVLNVNAKPIPLLSADSAPTASYGDAEVTISGRVTPPTSPIDVVAFGNGARDGEKVTVIVGSIPPTTNVTDLINGTFSTKFNTAGLGVGSQFPVFFDYAGGINLAPVPMNAQNANTFLTVNKKTITLVPNNQTKVYGENDPNFSYTPLPPNPLVGTDKFIGAMSREGIVNNDPTTTPVGSYRITQGSFTITNDNGSWAYTNYTIVFDDTKRLNITQRPITVKITSATKTYGDANPYFTNMVTGGLVGTDKISGDAACTASTTTQVSQSPVAITRGTLTAGPNYAASYENGSLSILPKPITVTFASNITKTYGNADPDDPNFSGTINGSGMTNGMTVSPGLVGTDKIIGVPHRTAGETVAGSPYAIDGLTGMSFTPSSGNYAVTYIPGALTINRRPVTVAAGNDIGTRKYGDNLVPFVKYTGLVGSGNGAGVPAQSAPATTPASVVWGANGTPTKCGPQGLPKTYPYTIKVSDASDPNHSFSPSGDISANYIIGPAPLVVRAKNKSMQYTGSLFPYASFEPTYNTFVCPGDDENTALSGFLTYTGPAITAVDPGVYAIIPGGKNTLDNKYAVTHEQGYLSITATPRTNATDTLAWEPGASAAWMVNDPNGLAGKNPGWTLFKVTGALQINATSGNKFRLDLVTMEGDLAKRMPKFDPTRPYTWLLVDAGSISGFATDKFWINWDGSANGGGLFANPVFGGTFSIRQGLAGEANKLFLDFTPVGAARDAAGIVSTSPSSVDPGYNVGPLLTDVTTTADLDTVYLSPDRTSVKADGTEDVVVSLNVANLNQPIVGLNGYVKFDASQWLFKKIEAGGGVWTSLIYFVTNAGNADIVVAVNLTASVGTSADATVAKLTLTPTRTATSTSRVIFRADGTATVAEGGSGTGVLTYLQPAQAGGAKILPARVMTPLITIANDPDQPTFGTITAKQIQPSYTGAGTTDIDVKDGADTNRRQAVRTDGNTSGNVRFVVNASDSGVGLSGPPTVTRKRSADPSPIPVASTDPATKTTQPFNYEWAVGASDDGDWTITIIAADRKDLRKTNTFMVRVNTREIQGVVELEGFAGTSRTVNFKTGDQVAGGSIRDWNPSLTFTSGYLLPVGSFQNRAGMASKIAQAADSVSSYLAYGDILNLAALRDSLLNKQGGVSTWIHALLYGKIDMGFPLLSLSGKLTNPNRSVDAYVVSRLSSDTVLKLAAYSAASNQDKPTLAPALITALLNDFNTIVLGSSIYNPVRFASVNLGGDTQTALGGSDTVAINRYLLRDAYPEYQPGKLRAATAQKLTQNDPALLGALLEAFDTIAISPSMWPTPTQGYGPCLYNEQVFLGVTLSSATLGMLTENPFPSDTRLTLLNQRLLEDAYPGVFVRAPLSPATVAAARNYSSPEAFESGMVADLNALIGGQSIYTAARFPLIGVPFDTSTELGALLAKTSPTAAERIRMNRLLLESAYSELSKGVLAQFRLVQVLSISELSASTAWNLRVRQLVDFGSQNMATINFIGNGQPSWQAGADSYLRGGDLAKDSDNQVNLADFFVLSQSWLTTAGGPADVNGDGNVSGPDYTLMLGNWGMVGDTEVK